MRLSRAKGERTTPWAKAAVNLGTGHTSSSGSQGQQGQERADGDSGQKISHFGNRESLKGLKQPSNELLGDSELPHWATRKMAWWAVSKILRKWGRWHVVDHFTFFRQKSYVFKHV